MKKIIAMLTVAALALGALTFCGCGSKSSSDLDYIKGKGEIVVGVTQFKPMDYLEGSKWVGFDAEFAEKIGEKLGLKVKFQEIEWGQKVNELNTKNVDLLWNGMTADEKLGESIDFSSKYMVNSQVIVINKANASKFSKLEDFAKAKLACEDGSAGQTVISEDDVLKGASTTPVDGMAKALLEVKSGRSDAAVVDSVLAEGVVGDGTDYSDLMVVDGIKLSDEEYAIGMRKGSDFKAELDKAIAEMQKDGSLKKIAEKYKVANSLK